RYGGSVRVRGPGLGDQVFADLAGEFRPDGPDSLAPGSDIPLGQGLDLGLAGVGDALAVAVVDLGGQLVGVLGGARHGLLQPRADVFGQAVPPAGIGDHHVVQGAVVGDRDGLLDFVELLRVDVGPGVVGPVDHTGLRRLVDVGDGQLLRVGAQLAELGLEHVGGLDAELQALDVFRTSQRVLVGGHLLEAVVPVGQALGAL